MLHHAHVTRHDPPKSCAHAHVWGRTMTRPTAEAPRRNSLSLPVMPAVSQMCPVGPAPKQEGAGARGDGRPRTAGADDPRRARPCRAAVPGARTPSNWLNLQPGHLPAPIMSRTVRCQSREAAQPEPVFVLMRTIQHPETPSGKSACAPRAIPTSALPLHALPCVKHQAALRGVCPSRRGAEHGAVMARARRCSTGTFCWSF